MQCRVNGVEDVMRSAVDTIRRIDAEADRSRALVVSSFSEYMAKVAPSPFLLPVTVTIRLMGRSKCWRGVSLKPTETLWRVIDFIKNEFNEMSDPIKEFKEGESMSIGIVRRPVIHDDDDDASSKSKGVRKVGDEDTETKGGDDMEVK